MNVLRKERDYLEEVLGIEREERRKMNEGIRKIREEKLEVATLFEKLKLECAAKDSYLLKLRNNVNLYTE